MGTLAETFNQNRKKRKKEKKIETGMKNLLGIIIATFGLKLLVFIGVFNGTDRNKPIDVNIDFENKTINAKLNKVSGSKYHYKIIEGKALIENKLVNDGDIITINGDKYLVDVKINYVELNEYDLFQKIVHNFSQLDAFPIFKWTFIIRSLIYLIAMIAFMEFKEAMLWSFISISILTFLTFTIVNTFGWTGWWGYILYITIIIIDAIIGFQSTNEDY